MKQTEKPSVTMDQMESMVGQRPTYLSGGQIEGFREGWAHNIMGGMVSHYYKRNAFDTALSLCGAESQARWIYGAGNYPTCKKCQRAAAMRQGGVDANYSHQ